MIALQLLLAGALARLNLGIARHLWAALRRMPWANRNR